MVRTLVAWALNSPLIVLLLALTLGAVGAYSFKNINVEAYPDPAPAILDIVAQYPGASAEEVERQVTIPLETTLSGMPHLMFLRSKSLFGLSDVHVQFEYGYDYDKAKQEVINRLSTNLQPLPPGVTPSISPETPTGEIYRYTLDCPKDPQTGEDIYTRNDLKALQDWVLEREFKRVAGVVDVTSFGGTVKRYEIHPDPERLKQFGITLAQVQTALANANQNTGGDVVQQGDVAMSSRSVGLFGLGLDPVRRVLGMKDPNADAARALAAAEAAVAAETNPKIRKEKEAEAARLRQEQRIRLATAAARILREEENDRIREIRGVVVTTITGPSGNNREILLEDIVEGGRLQSGYSPNVEGVVVGNQTRLGRVGLRTPETALGPAGIARAKDPRTNKLLWRDEDDKVQCIVLLRKNEDSLPVIERVQNRVKELNDPNSGRMLPGVRIEPYYDRADLIGLTTETVRENMLVGMALVTVILLMFLSNVRSALIVAINIPLALLFAFSVMFARGKSANLLSIGAVDFGIIVDSSVIIVENIYRHISTGEHAEQPLRDRILRACGEVERALFFSTAIMVCAFIPLFTMQGPEGQIFGPMADTYAYALSGALLLALFLAPVLCLLCFRNLKPAEDNFLVRYLRNSYLRQLERFLRYRWVTLGVFSALIAFTAIYAVPRLGNEFMPELEEGNLWIRGTFPLNIGLNRVAEQARVAREIMSSFPEVEITVDQLGRPDDGTDSTGFFNSEYFVPLRQQKQWPKVKENHGLARLLWGAKRTRTKQELAEEMKSELNRRIPGVDWNFSQNIRDNVMESLSGIKGDNSVKIFGPDLDELEKKAAQVKARLQDIEGMESVGVFNIKGNTNLEFHVDPQKCKKYGVSAADINNVIQTAVGGKALSTMIEGEKSFDITARWPNWRRSDVTSILDIPVDLLNNLVIPASGPGVNPSPSGTGQSAPSKSGSMVDTGNPITNTPRVRLRDLVSPIDKPAQLEPEMFAPTAVALLGMFAPGQGHVPILADATLLPDVLRTPDPSMPYQRSGASTIYREQGGRMIAVKFSVNAKRDLAGAVAEAQEKTADLLESPYRAVWSGEFEEMQASEQRLMYSIPASMVLIFILLYLAFRSFLDALLVLSNVVALSLGGIWALLLTHTNFSISAAVGFVSIFGVAIMDGLLSISYFNAIRARGVPLREAILQGAAKRVRPMMMTALTAVFGLLPAALSTRIGSQSQRPLAIVVVGGMIMTLLLNRYLMPVLYSFYGHREPPSGSGGLAH
jgi:cobalt-zinc-cadmium resistance protein CzcA